MTNLSRIITVFVCMFFCLNLASAAEVAAEDSSPQWNISLSTGAVYNFPMSLKIKQSGQPEINTTAHYDTKPFTMPPYYSVRIARWKNEQSWEFELIHHKLYLSNLPKNVQEFTITNGYNLLIINHGFKEPAYIWRLGLGIVLTHPESTVRGKKFNEHGGIRTFDTDGYFISGAVAQGAIEKRYDLNKNLFVYGEAKLTAAFASVPIYGGFADAPNIALHGVLGIGCKV